jgi:hypothetical protein
MIHLNSPRRVDGVEPFQTFSTGDFTLVQM